MLNLENKLLVIQWLMRHIASGQVDTLEFRRLQSLGP
jgi:hypothetical protein